MTVTDSTPDTTTSEPKAVPRLKTRYREEIKPALTEQFSFSNQMMVPGVVSWTAWKRRSQ